MLWGHQERCIGELSGVRVTDRESTSSPWGDRQFQSVLFVIGHVAHATSRAVHVGRAFCTHIADRRRGYLGGATCRRRIREHGTAGDLEHPGRSIADRVLPHVLRLISPGG
ncbi:hypothetical protein UI24_20515 [Mycobacteroides franklinii]|nr:hypothetical protein [Mycobacteroides franklinii]